MSNSRNASRAGTPWIISALNHLALVAGLLCTQTAVEAMVAALYKGAAAPPAISAALMVLWVFVVMACYALVQRASRLPVPKAARQRHDVLGSGPATAAD